MEGCGYRRSDFSAVELLPSSRRYRDFLDEWSAQDPWVVGAAVLTIFVEGSVNERRELAALEQAPETDAQIEEHIKNHPLVRIHGLDAKFLELQRVHRKVEGGHRRDAWDAVLKNVTAKSERGVQETMERALQLWLAYRDDVVAACGISR
jgi:hypothetical protein